ncbi:MAG: MnmC family methyltransferase [Nanoarchaeota archaeon]
MFRKILTADNTETFLNEKVGESYHSQTGAVEEAVNKYVTPCKIRELAKKGSIRILDVCFGMGYNSALAISAALEVNPDCKIEVIGLEYDREIISKIQEVNPPIPFFNHYKKLSPSALEFDQGKVSVKVILGDARETVKELKSDNFDAVFFDPFSPLTAPEMWVVSFFEEIHRVMKNSGLFATYSSSELARKNLSGAGFMYDDGPMKGRRGPGTIATKWV